MDASLPHVFGIDDFTSPRYIQLFQRPSVFLSASIPYQKDTIKNSHYLKTAQPRRVIDAVSFLARAVFCRELNLIFGGHPAISPMVLDIARRFLDQTEPRVAVFQSMFFYQMIPQDTLRLAEWDYGHLFWTQRCSATPSKNERDASLTWMRTVMLHCPNLVAAVFVGGMEGCEEEADLARNLPGKLPCFAIGSSGSAAGDLLKSDPQRFSGSHATESILRGAVSYPLVMKRILADIGY